MGPHILLLLFVAANGQFITKPPACVHSNVDQLSADKVIIMFLAELDVNKDGIISVSEVFQEVLIKFDSNGDSQLSEYEFITQWHQKFRDVPEFAGYLFNHFDQDCSGSISAADAPQLITTFDLDHDRTVTEIEFAEYMSNLYYDCVPHYHQQSCNIG